MKSPAIFKVTYVNSSLTPGQNASMDLLSGNTLLDNVAFEITTVVPTGKDQVSLIGKAVVYDTEERVPFVGMIDLGTDEHVCGHVILPEDFH